MTESEGNAGKENGEDEAGPRPPDWLERIVSLVSAVLVLGIVGFLIREATHSQRPAQFEVRTSEVRPFAGSFEIPVAVRNVGDAAAKDVAIHVTVGPEDDPIGESDIIVDWLPGHSEHQATAVMRSDPRQSAIRAEVRGYNTP